MDMSGLTGTPPLMDRALIARVVKALMKLDRATRTKSGLSKRADIGRMTLDRVFEAKVVRPDTYQALDDALLLPAGTLEALGVGNEPTELGLPDDLLGPVERAIGAHPDGPGRNAGQM